MIVGEHPQFCKECGSPLAADQRYCLVCGARARPHSPQVQELLSSAAARAGGGASSGAGVPSAGAGANGAPAAPNGAPGGAEAVAQAGGLRLPGVRVSALLVVVFLGFGVLLGRVARDRVDETPVAERSPVKLVLPSTTASVAPTTTSAPSSEGSASETPTTGVEAEATPAPAPAATTKAPASSRAPASKGTSGSEGAGSSEEASEEGGSTSQSGSSQPAAGAPAKSLPPIKHVFVIMLSDEPYASAFGPSSAASYLVGTLEHEGKLLVDFHAVAHEELADEVALVSGQGPTAETAANCATYTAITPTGSEAYEQVLGNGCVYPRSVQTLPGALEAKHLSWRAYVQGIDEGGPEGACQHPALGAADPTANQATSAGAYATFRNPFVYLDSIVESPGCTVDDVGLPKLRTDLAKGASTPNFSYIVPDRCHDGNPTPCNPGAPAGMAQTNSFLEQVVPEITGSKAYKENGLLVITVDEAPSTGAFADSSSCCGQPLFPNAPAKTLAGTPKGGGLVGALLLSPYMKGGTTSEEPYNDFSLLRTIEELFGLPRLGYTSLPAVKPFEPGLFTAGKSSLNCPAGRAAGACRASGGRRAPGR